VTPPLGVAGGWWQGSLPTWTLMPSTLRYDGFQGLRRARAWRDNGFKAAWLAASLWIDIRVASVVSWSHGQAEEYPKVSLPGHLCVQIENLII
jgi:hypothetical protein